MSATVSEAIATVRPAASVVAAVERRATALARTAERQLTGLVARDVVWAALCVVAAALGLVTLYHLNQPKPYVPYHDTWEYIRRADTILGGGSWVDPIRMPGYPLLLATVFAFAGKSNLVAADAMQQILFVVGALEVFALAQRALRSLSVATLVGLMFATNVYIYSFFKPILSDGLAMTLVVGMALAAVTFVERPSPVRFWLVALLTLAAVMTRAEWVLLPVALFPALLLFAARGGARQVWRRLVPQAALATASLYGATLAYMVFNARVNGYFGLSDASNINLYGKVTQYGMQQPASGRLAHVGQVTEWYVNRGLIDPWSIYWRAHEISGPHFTLMGAYARQIILRHPLTFLAHSVPVGFESLGSMYVFGKYHHVGATGLMLHGLQYWSLIAQPLYGLFPVCALGWLLALIWRWRRGPRDEHWSASGAARMCLLAGIAAYGVVITTLTSYDEYARLHLDIDSLMLIVTVGALAVAWRGARAWTPALARQTLAWMRRSALSSGAASGVSRLPRVEA